MKERVSTRLRSEKGFYVGDLAYAMSDEDFEGEWQDESIEGVHELRGHTFAVICIGDSDRTYLDSKGREYMVCSGHIGILPLELCGKSKEEMESYGTVVKTNLAFFDANNGVVNAIFNNGESIIIEQNMDYSREETKQYELLMEGFINFGGN